MTNEELQAIIRKLESAVRSGEILENGGPVGSKIMVINNENYSYSIKPKPREVWLPADRIPSVNQAEHGVTVAGEKILDCGLSGLPPKHSMRKFREVLE